MNEILSFFQSYFVNQAFLATLLIITLNNVNKKIQIKKPLQIIRYVIILSGFTSLVGMFISQAITPDFEGNALALIKRTTGSYKVFFIFTLTCSVLFPFVLLIKKYGVNKYIILVVSSLISIGFWFEKFVIYTTRNHRGHLDQGMNLQINSYSIRVAIIITLLTINLLLFIRKESKIHPDKSEIDSDLIE